jgi:hypothetical protein
MSNSHSPVQIVQAHLDALNAHDLAAAMAHISKDVVVSSNIAIDTGNDYALYSDYLRNLIETNPQFRFDLLDRMNINQTVIDEVVLAGLERGGFHAISIYEIADGLITGIRVIADEAGR